MERYPVVIERDGRSYVARFPDCPQAHTFGPTKAAALKHAADALETAFIALMNDRKDLPKASPARGRDTVALPPLSIAKIGLYRAMREADVTKAELGRRLGCHAPQIDRLLDLRHASRLELIDEALRTLGKVLTITVQDAA